MSEKIIAYKAMDKNMQCRGKQYEVGKTYTEDEADCCNAGMHACEMPFDVLHYYHVSDGARFFRVECGGEVDKSNDDSKFACTELTVNGELKLTDMLKIGVEAVMKRVKEKTAGAKETAASGDYSTGAASGLCSTGAASGLCSTGAASGDYSTGAASGDYSTGAASGLRSTGAASGLCSTGAASGDYSTGAASGLCSTGAASGLCSTGAASGLCSTGAASGLCSTGAASGDYSTAEVSGKDSIAVANGIKSKARGALGCYLILTEYNDDGNLICAKMERVDGSKVKENVYYTLKNGEFVEWSE